MIRIRKIPRPIDKDAPLLGLKLNQGLLFLGICLLLILNTFVVPSVGKVIRSVLMATAIYLYFFLEIGASIRRFLNYVRTPKKQTGESISEFDELGDISINNQRKTVFNLVETEANFGALDFGYQEQLASEYAAAIYEMTESDAIVKVVSYTTSENLESFKEQLDHLNRLDVSDRVKYIYSKRLSLHARIGDKAVKNNYVVKINLPKNSETEWEDVLLFGHPMGSNKIKKSQIKQLLPIQRLERGHIS